MPVSVKRQMPTSNGRAAVQVEAPAGSLLSRGIPVGELAKAEFASVLIYGGNRVGKTTLACQFPKPLALISFEPSPFTGGASSVTRIDGVTYFQVVPATALAFWPKTRGEPIPGLDGALQLAEELRESGSFRSLVLDGGTSLEDVALCEIMNLPELPAQMKVARSKDDRSWGVATSDQYQDRSSKAKEVVRKFLNLSMHRVLLAKEKDHNPPRDDKGNVRRDKLTRGLQIESFIAASMGQSTVGWLNDACDWICRLYIAKETVIKKFPVAGGFMEQEVETGRSVRRLLMQLHPNFAAGGRCSNPEIVPEYIEDQKPEGMYRKLEKLMRGEKP